MVMKARFMVETPDDVVATMKVTMTVREWVELRDQLASMYPSWKFASMISELVTQARKVYHAEHETNA